MDHIVFTDQLAHCLQRETEEAVVGEKDACGVGTACFALAKKLRGMIANMDKPASHDLLKDPWPDSFDTCQVALRALSCMEHRGACSGGMDSILDLRPAGGSFFRFSRASGIALAQGQQHRQSSRQLMTVQTDGELLVWPPSLGRITGCHVSLQVA